MGTGRARPTLTRIRAVPAYRRAPDIRRFVALIGASTSPPGCSPSRRRRAGRRAAKAVWRTHRSPRQATTDSPRVPKEGCPNRCRPVSRPPVTGGGQAVTSRTRLLAVSATATEADPRRGMWRPRRGSGACPPAAARTAIPPVWVGLAEHRSAPRSPPRARPPEQPVVARVGEEQQLARPGDPVRPAEARGPTPSPRFSSRGRGPGCPSIRSGCLVRRAGFPPAQPSTRRLPVSAT